MSGIYLHIPFCKQACHYCDFHFSTSLKKKDELVQAIASELILRKDEINTPIETIYFGGGTPSLLSIDELRFLIDAIYKNFTVIKNPEVTIEANPDDLASLMPSNNTSTTIFEQYRSIGINRLSIGIQSFFEDDLVMMNRAHNSKEAENCLSEATRYFDNITIDLIYGVPNMSNEKWTANIEKALSFGIKHISSYALTVEPKTALASFIAKGEIDAPKDAVAHEHFQILVNTLEKNGFVHYELSNFGKPNYFSKHNTSYWLGKPYLGVGPSAHSFNGAQRSWNVANNTKYINSIEKNTLPIERETLSIDDRYNEYVMTGLRTIYGVSLNKVSNDFGTLYEIHIKKMAQKHIDQGLLMITSEVEQHSVVQIQKLFTTAKGKFLCDGIASDLFKV
ncbi:MAG: radical SAM family heme chaperone HemW [Flavobacteriaceae bacterium]|nr:radical SAM family heme chaperone HemW [Flavobacteriaceae bacterium]